MADAQKLLAANLAPDPAEELGCRIKDPLWFLARQWQTGEFQAENGGTPALVRVVKADHPLTHATLGRDSGPRRVLNLAEPLDSVIEAEIQGDAPAWRSQALDYAFETETSRHRLVAEGYTGKDLDWWHFDYGSDKRGAHVKEETLEMVPTMLHFKGAPHPRWWRFEDGDAYFDAPVDPEPNALSLLLPEFFYTDVDNWYVLPVPMLAGSVREVLTVTVIDGFGIATEIKPAHGGDEGEADWRLFTLAGQSDGRTVDGRFFFAPHIAGDILDNDPVEDVRFLRDEESNLAWAVEVLYTDDDGKRVRNGDQPRLTRDGDTLEVPAGFDGIFRLQSHTPDHWIPYVPRFSAPGGGAVNGDIHLRRGRTREDATDANPQYKGRIVGETVRLNEEELAESGVRVRRVHRYSRGTDGRPVHWVARVRDVTHRPGSDSGLKFDFVKQRNE